MRCDEASTGEVVRALAAIVGEEGVRRDAPLAPLTTFRVGGPADCLVDVHGSEELALVVDACRRHGVAWTILGGGSNTLVADEGLRGVVVRPHGGRIEAGAQG